MAKKKDAENLHRARNRVARSEIAERMQQLENERVQQVQMVIHADAKTLMEALLLGLPKLFQGRLPAPGSSPAGSEAEHKIARSMRMVSVGASGACRRVCTRRAHETHTKPRGLSGQRTTGFGRMPTTRLQLPCVTFTRT